jgi:arylsulfatase A-like enzyme
MKDISRRSFLKNLAISSVAISASTTLLNCIKEKKTQPTNIIFIMADDLGYGDLGCYGANKIPTPNIDKLAAEGMLFTDAHAPGAVCIPSRYGLLTGRYPFRQNGHPNKGPLIEKDRKTIASLLKEQGYRTAMVGKWHLGFEGGINFDYSKPLRGGHFDCGFDYFYGQHASLDIPPYFYIENDKVVQPPTDEIEANNSDGWSRIQGAFWRKGAIAPGYEIQDVLPRFTQKSVEWLERQAKQDSNKPFFLYVAFTAPHTPWMPLKQFLGKSEVDMYGDFVAQVDDAVGQILNVVNNTGVSEKTLIIFTSDNGPVWYPEDVERFGHSSTNIFRGMKGDAYEGGHRMPFITKWPGKIKPGSKSNETICFTDMLATFAAITNTQLSTNEGEDSFNILPIMLGEKRDIPIREATVLQSSRGYLAIRQGDWKLIPGLGSGGFTKPAKIEPETGQPKGQLYNLKTDPSEKTNLWTEKPELVDRLTTILDRYKQQGYSRPNKIRLINNTGRPWDSWIPSSIQPIWMNFPKKVSFSKMAFAALPNVHPAVPPS